jgi:hypothetical protein
MKKEMTGQDQMNIVRRLTVEFGMDQDLDISGRVWQELEERGIIYDQDLIEELTEDVEYRYEHEMAILEMDKGE